MTGGETLPAAVVFDLDDTLHDDTATYRRAAELTARDVAASHGIDAEALLRAYVVQAEHFWKTISDRELKTPLASVRTAMWTAALAEGAGLTDAVLAGRCADAYNAYRKAHLQLWPGVLDLLDGLRAQGCALGLLTNGFAETHREKIVLLGLERAFDEVFIADEVGMLKPDPRLFRLACERLGAPPERAAMVGDRFERDIRGAHAVGMFTVWVNVRGENVPPDGPEPDATVAGIDEVPAALRRFAPRAPGSAGR